MRPSKTWDGGAEWRGREGRGGAATSEDAEEDRNPAVTGVTGVTDGGGALVGIITDGDLRRHMQGLLDLDAAAVMTPAPRTIAPGALAEAALAQMQDSKITCLFAVDEGRPCGILHIHDCLRAGLV